MVRRRVVVSLVLSSIAVVVACRGQPSADLDLDRERQPSWQELSDALDLETGLGVFATAFSCGLTAEELRRLREISASESRVDLVLLANPGDSTAVAAFGRDIGFSSYRTMTHSRLRALVGTDHTLPLFVLFKRGKPMAIVSGSMSRRLDALEVFF